MNVGVTYPLLELPLAGADGCDSTVPPVGQRKRCECKTNAKKNRCWVWCSFYYEVSHRATRNGTTAHGYGYGCALITGMGCGPLPTEKAQSNTGSNKLARGMAQQ